MTYYGEIDGRRIGFSRHALERAAEMKIGPDEIREAYIRPVAMAHSISYQGCTNYHGKRITLAMDLRCDPPHVVTVLWNSKENWDKYFSGIGETDREHRPGYHVGPRRG